MTITSGLTLASFLFFGLGAVHSAYAAPPIDNCAMLTPAQIQKVMGQPFGPPTADSLIPPFGTKWGSHCIYKSQANNGGTVVHFFVYVTSSPVQAKQWFDMSAGAHKRSQPLAIGDAAFLDKGEVHVQKGKILFWLSVDQQHAEQEKELATVVAANI